VSAGILAKLPRAARRSCPKRGLHFSLVGLQSANEKTHSCAPRSVAPLLGIALALFGAHALAFKSERGNSTHSPPTPPPLFPFPGHGSGVSGGVTAENDYELTSLPDQSPHGGLRYLFHVIHEAHAGIAGLDRSLSILPGLYLCPSSARSGSLEGCVPLSKAAADEQKWPWLESRLASDSPKSEHLTIPKAAAAVAGLPSSLGAPFFLRYPSFNSLIASSKGTAQSHLTAERSLRCISATVLRELASGAANCDQIEKSL
jgi:hypothetical protein